MKRAEVMIDPCYKESVEADEWIASGTLTLRLRGEPVAQFNRWVSVKWAEQLEHAPLVDMIGESATQ